MGHTLTLCPARDAFVVEADSALIVNLDPFPFSCLIFI